MKRTGLVHVATLAAVTATGLSCSYTFPRLDDLPPGTVAGRTIDAESTVLSFTRVGLDATPRIVRSLDDGTFRVQGLSAGSWLLRMASDADGDGEAERSAIRAVKINSVTDLKGAKVLSSVLLGDVTLDGTASLIGRVVKADPADASATIAVPGARVVAFRSSDDLDDAQNVGVGALAVDLGIEQETASDAEGFFRLSGVATGTVRVAAVDVDDGLASAPVLAVATPGRVVPVEDVLLLAGGTRPGQVDILNPPADGSLVVDVVKHGGDRTSESDALVHHEVDVAGDATSIAGFDVPTGVVDVYVSDVDGAGAQRRSGALIGRVVAQGDGAVVWGDVELVGAGNECGDATDRDGDGLAALPDPSTSAAVAAQWVTCASQCADAFGFGGAQPATCKLDDGSVADCDDDDDGQPDVTEPFKCVSLCGGTDLDGDGVCSGADSFPQCAENDAAAGACSFEDKPFDPPKPVYGAEGEGEGEGEGDVGCTGSGGPLVPVPLPPVSDWTPSNGNTGVLDCDDPNNPNGIGRKNPREQSFVEDADSVTFSSIADDGNCCTCIERVAFASFPTAVDNVVAIVGQLDTTFAGDFAQADVELEVRGVARGSVPILDTYLKTEDRPNNNCLNTNPRRVDVPNGTCFSVPLDAESLVTSVTVRLQGYGCVDGTASVKLSNLAVERAAGSEGEGEGEGEGDVDNCVLPAPTCLDQTVAVDCQASLLTLAALDCGTVNQLFLTGTVADLAPLAGLQHVTGALTVSGTSRLTSLDGLGLLDVSGVVLQDNTALGSMTGLATLTSVGTAVDISGNPQLTSLAGLDTVDVDRAFVLLQNDPALVDLAGFGNQGFIQSLVVDNIGISDFSDFADVTQVGSIEIRNNPSLVSLAGLGATVSPTSVVVQDNPVLTSMPFYASLSSAGVLRIDGNNALATLPPSTLQSVNELDITNNAILRDGGSLFQLTTLGALTIANNPALTAGPSFSGQLQASLDVTLQNCDALTNANPLSGIQGIFGNLTINGNDGMTSLAGLNLGSLGGILDIENNPSLLQCLADNLASSLNKSPTSGTYIFSGNNPSTAGCP